jgi:hypothetical protein
MLSLERKVVMKIIGFILTLILGSLAFASHFTGTYQDQSGLVVVIEHGTDTIMKGMVVGNGLQLQLQGQGNEQGAQGKLIGPQGQMSFQAQLSPDGKVLQLMVFQLGPDGKPNQQSAQQFSLQRSSNTPQPPTQPNPMPLPPQPGPNPPQPGPVPPAPGPTPPTPNPLGPDNPLNPGGNPLNPQGDAWSGVYVGNAGQLTVVVQAAQGGYAGYIELSGTRYPFQAQGDEYYLEGAFQSPNGNFEFALERDETYVYLYSGDTEYVLEKQNAPAGTSPATSDNPLNNP